MSDLTPAAVAEEIMQMIDAADDGGEVDLNRQQLEALVTDIYQFCEHVVDAVITTEEVKA